MPSIDGEITSSNLILVSTISRSAKVDSRHAVVSWAPASVDEHDAYCIFLVVFPLPRMIVSILVNRGTKHKRVVNWPALQHHTLGAHALEPSMRLTHHSC